MLKRVLVAVVCVPLIFVVFYLLPPICLPIVLSLLSMVAVHEVLWSAGFVKHFRISAYSIALAGLVPFWVFFGESRLLMLCTLLLYLTLMFIEAFFSRFSVTMEKMGGAFFFAVLIPYFLSSFVRIGQMPDAMLKLLVPLTAAFGSDIFAMLTGMLFGRHKLAPRLSPNKTVEGAAGGVFGGVFCSVVYALVLQYFFGATVNYLFIAIYGVLGSLAAQVGDLAFSYIKRQYQIKDFGNVFPGHGGVLDRCDSVIFATPLIEVLLVLLPAILA